MKYITNFVKLLAVEEAYKKGQDLCNFNSSEEDCNLDYLPHFVGSIDRKSEMRETMLSKLQYYKNEYPMYEELLEQFINMEENFIENGC